MASPIPGVNFTNILQAAFCAKVVYPAFLYVQFGFVIFLSKEYWQKSARKMLVKLAEIN